MLSGTSIMSSNHTWLFYMKYLTKLNWKWQMKYSQVLFSAPNQCKEKGTENAIRMDFSIGLVRWLQVSSELSNACIYSHRYWKMVFLQAVYLTHVSAIFREKYSLAKWLIHVWHLELQYAYAYMYTQTMARSINCHMKRTICWHFAYVLYTVGWFAGEYAQYCDVIL